MNLLEVKNTPAGVEPDADAAAARGLVAARFVARACAAVVVAGAVGWRAARRRRAGRSRGAGGCPCLSPVGSMLQLQTRTQGRPLPTRNTQNQVP